MLPSHTLLEETLQTSSEPELQPRRCTGPESCARAKGHAAGKSPGSCVTSSAGRVYVRCTNRRWGTRSALRVLGRGHGHEVHEAPLVLPQLAQHGVYVVAHAELVEVVLVHVQPLHRVRLAIRHHQRRHHACTVCCVTSHYVTLMLHALPGDTGVYCTVVIRFSGAWPPGNYDVPCRPSQNIERAQFRDVVCGSTLQ